MAHDFGRIRVGARGDAAEREAEHAAARVDAAGPALRRSAVSTGAAEGVAPPVVHEVLRGPGAPLDAEARAALEPRFGHDFGRVRVHADARAAASARAVGANAYTVGSDVVFAAGRYAPATPEGRRLLAHELAHVVQQAGAAGPPLLQRDLAIEPVSGGPQARTLTAEDIKAAVKFNEKKFKDPYSLAVIRDLLGISRFPAVSDEALAQAVARWQDAHGIAQDGQLGPVTVTYIVEELQAEGLDRDAELIKLDFPRGTFLDVDTSFCGCETELEDEIRQADAFIAHYQACGSDTTVPDGPAVETCVDKRVKAGGGTLTTLGTTSASGVIRLTGRSGPCAKLLVRTDLAHEQIHSVHTSELQQQHGRGTKAFHAAREDKGDWVQDEVNSRETDKAVAQWAIGVLGRICP